MRLLHVELPGFVGFRHFIIERDHVSYYRGFLSTETQKTRNIFLRIVTNHDDMRWIWLVITFVFLTTFSFADDRAPALPLGGTKWLDGKAMQWSELRGKVVLLNVWTFACWNSYRSLPWVVSLQKKFPDLQIIGVHSPEFDYEKNRNQLRSTMAKYSVSYPQLLDDNHDYWDSLNNQYWPAFYVVDKQGKIRGRFSGETHADDQQAKEIEDLIERLRKEN